MVESAHVPTFHWQDNARYLRIQAQAVIYNWMQLVAQPACSKSGEQLHIEIFSICSHIIQGVSNPWGFPYKHIQLGRNPPGIPPGVSQRVGRQLSAPRQDPGLGRIGPLEKKRWNLEVSINGGYHNSWMVFVRGKSAFKWMMTGGLALWLRKPPYDKSDINVHSSSIWIHIRYLD